MFYIYENWVTHGLSARIHKGECRFCNEGIGIHGTTNIFTERHRRSVKYEEVYLNDYLSPREARNGLARYFHFYNFERPHQALDYRTPALAQMCY